MSFYGNFINYIKGFSKIIVGSEEIECPETPSLSLRYDTDNKKIHLTLNGKDASSIDATDFIKDGMLQSVTLEEKDEKTYLVFVWNTDGGATKIELDVTDLARYTYQDDGEGNITIV